MNTKNGYIRGTLYAVSGIFILAGVAGLFLPFLQGILFLAIGFYILSVVSPAFKHKFDRILARYPRLKAHIDRQHERLSRFFHRKHS